MAKSLWWTLGAYWTPTDPRTLKKEHHVTFQFLTHSTQSSGFWYVRGI